MNFFNFEFKKALIIVLVLSLPLISINTQQNLSAEESWFSRPFSLIAAGIQSGFFEFSTGVKDSVSLYLNLVGINSMNRILRQENDELMARINQMGELAKENDRLRALLQFREGSKMQLRAARVIGRDLVPEHNTISINKGTEDGLKSGMAVITTKGAVGYVFRPRAYTSHVMLITDRYAVVDGLVARSRTQGIVEGKSVGLQMKYVEKTADIKEGDAIVTGGLDNIFPKGFSLATVTKIERKNYSTSLKIDLEPVIAPKEIEEVFVILNAASEDLLKNPVAEVGASGTGVASDKRIE